jgi:hypothetical protein
MPSSNYLIIVPVGAGGAGGDGYAMTASPGGVPFGSDGTSNVTTKIENFVTDTCLATIVNRIIDANLGNEMSNEMLSIFGKSEKMNLYFYQRDTNISDSPGNHKVTRFDNGFVNYNVYIDLTKMPNASDQYKAVVIIHEIAHAIIKSNNLNINTSIDAHYLMLEKYIQKMKVFLQDAFSLNDEDALSMIFEGIADIAPIQDQLNIDSPFLEMLKYYKLSNILGDSNNIYQITQNFKYGKKGTTSCKF